MNSLFEIFLIFAMVLLDLRWVSDDLRKTSAHALDFAVLILEFLFLVGALIFIQYKIAGM